MSDRKNIISSHEGNPDAFDVDSFDGFDRELAHEDAEQQSISEDIFKVSDRNLHPEMHDISLDTPLDASDGDPGLMSATGESFEFETFHHRRDETQTDEAMAEPSETEKRRARAVDILDEARAKAQAILNDAQLQIQEAKAEAKKLVEKAQSESDQIEANAYQAGFAQGEEAGHSLSEQKIESITRNLESVLQELGSQRAALIQENEEELVRIAFLMATKILHHEIYDNQGGILDLVKSSLERLKHSSKLTVYVSPNDFRFIEDHIESLEGFTSDETKVSVEPDNDIARGGCLVKSDTGEVDATIETMLKKLQSRIWSQQADETEDTNDESDVNHR